MFSPNQNKNLASSPKISSLQGIQDINTECYFRQVKLSNKRSGTESTDNMAGNIKKKKIENKAYSSASDVSFPVSNSNLNASCFTNVKNNLNLRNINMPYLNSDQLPKLKSTNESYLNGFRSSSLKNGKIYFKTVKFMFKNKKHSL